MISAITVETITLVRDYDSKRKLLHVTYGAYIKT